LAGAAKRSASKSTLSHHGSSGLLAAFFALLSYPLRAVAIAVDRLQIINSTGLGCRSLM
jgi:hypothetical protein